MSSFVSGTRAGGVSELTRQERRSIDEGRFVRVQFGRLAT